MCMCVKCAPLILYSPVSTQCSRYGKFEEWHFCSSRKLLTCSKSFLYFFCIYFGPSQLWLIGSDWGQRGKAGPSSAKRKCSLVWSVWQFWINQCSEIIGKWKIDSWKMKKTMLYWKAGLYICTYNVPVLKLLWGLWMLDLVSDQVALRVEHSAK